MCVPDFALLTICSFPFVRNGVNIMKIMEEDPEICQKSQKYDANFRHL